MPDVAYSYRPRAKKYTLTDTSTSLGNGASATIEVTVGRGFKGGSFHARSVKTVTSANVATVSGNLRGSSSSSDSTDSVQADGAYTSGYNRIVDGHLSGPMFSNAGAAIKLVNAYYEASTGKVKFTFTNTTGGTVTLSVRIGGAVWA